MNKKAVWLPKQTQQGLRASKIGSLSFNPAIFLVALLAFAGIAQAENYYSSVTTGTAGYYIGSFGADQFRTGQIFANLNATWYVTNVTFYVFAETGAPIENTLVRIETVVGGLPSGTLANPAYNATVLPAAMIAGTWVNATFGSSPALPPGTYALVFRQEIEAEAANQYYTLAETNALAGAGLTRVKLGGAAWTTAVNENVTAGIYYSLTAINALTINVTDCATGAAIPYYNLKLWNATASGDYYNATGTTTILYNATTPASGTGLALTVNDTYYDLDTFTLPEFNATSTIVENICLTPRPRVTISVFDELTVAPLVAGVALQNSTAGKTFSGSSTYNLTFYNLTYGPTTITANATSYYNRTLSETITTLTAKNLSVLLLPANASTSYTIYVRNLGGSAIPYVTYNVSKSVGGTTYTIATGTTDVNGLFVLYLHYGDTYQFTFSAGGYATATTDITASTLNPITVVLYSTSSVPAWNTTLSSLIPEYWGQPLVRGQTSIRTANVTFWGSDPLVVFTGSYAEYYYNNTLLLNSSYGPTSNVNTSLTIPLGYSGFVLQKYTVTANGYNSTFLTWIPILTSGSGGSPEYHSGLITLIAERLMAGDPTGEGQMAWSFLIIIGCLLVATFIGGATVMSTLIFLLLTAFFTFVLPILSWWYFMIIAVVAVAWIYVRGG